MKFSTFIFAVLFSIGFTQVPAFCQDHEYYVPYYSSTSGMGTGVAVRNLDNARSAEISVLIYNQSGSLLQTVPKTIPPGGQAAFVAGAGFSAEGSITVRSNRPIAGLCLIITAAENNYLADIPFTSTLSTLLVAPHVASNGEWDSSIYLSNPGQNAADMTLTLNGADGAIVQTLERTLPARGAGVIPLSELTQGQDFANGSVTVSGSEPMAGFVLYDNLKTGGYSHAGILAAEPARLGGGWTLYDDFSSGTIDPARWMVDDSSAVISVENGEAKFVHQAGNPNDSSWLQFPEPGKIKAIKADIRVGPCSGDVRARVAGTSFSDDQGNYIRHHIQLRNDRSLIDYWIGAVDPASESVRYDLYHTNFKSPIAISGGGAYTVHTNFDPTDTMAGVEGVGQVAFKSADIFRAAEAYLLSEGLGTRSNNGDGPCTVYIDNVHVRY